MGLWDSISRQLSEPTGLGGRVIAAVMNRGNAGINRGALERLEVAPGHRVLEIGFGGGATLATLLERGAEVSGLDRAADMVAAARRRYAEPIAAGELELVAGDVEAMPFPDRAFDRVLTVNTVYFWPDLAAAFREIARVLDDRGRLVVGIRDPAVMRKVSRDVFTIREPEAIRAAAEAAGFADARLDSPGNARVHFVVASTGGDATAAQPARAARTGT